MRRDDSRERAERNDFAPVVVLGPGHYWPYLRKPGYGLARQIPTMREGATRLGLVTLEQMVATLVPSVEAPPPAGTRIVEVPEIAAGGRLPHPAERASAYGEGVTWAASPPGASRRTARWARRSSSLRKPSQNSAPTAWTKRSWATFQPGRLLASDFSPSGVRVTKRWRRVPRFEMVNKPCF